MRLEQSARVDSLQNPFDNPLPEALQSEQEAMAVILSHPHAMAEVADRLQPEHFHRQCHQVIYGVCLELFHRGESITPGTVTQTISSKGQDTIEAVGGLSYVADLAFSATLPDALGWHADRILDASQRRSTIVALMDAATQAYDLSNDAYQDALQDAINRAQDINHLEAETTSSEDWVDATGETLDYLEAPEKFQGLSTGFAGLDAVLGGLRGGSQIILAARPGVGKSALAGRIALNVARATGDPVVFFSLEMKRNDVLRRLITAEARQPIGRWVPESQMPQAVARIAEAQERLYQVPLKVFELQSATLQAIQAKVMQHRNKHGGRLALIVVDYLQLMECNSYQGTRNLELSAISRGLKLLAMRLNVPLLALAQLNRQVEGRNDKRPQLADLRDSGAIEQDADQVLMLYRDETQATYGQGETLEVLVRKNRHGRVSSCTLGFEPDLVRFTDAIG